MKKLPKYFVIKRDGNNPLWNEYIQWLNETYGSNWMGDTFEFYGYDGSTSFNTGTNCHEHIKNFKNNPKLITLEYWNKCINGVSKKYIGYKLKDSCAHYKSAALEICVCYRDSWDYNFKEFGWMFMKDSPITLSLEKAGVLDQWFDKVYKEEEPEFKVGDWVITEGYSNGYDGLALKITSIKKEYVYFYSSHEDWADNHNFRLRYIKRKATPEEIKKATEIKMNFGEEVFTLKSDGTAHYSEGQINIDNLYNIIESIELAEKNIGDLTGHPTNIRTLKIGCKTGTVEELMAMRDKLESLIQ